MNVCTLPDRHCAFCGAPGRRRCVFLEERATSGKPEQRKIALDVCFEHEDPFRSDASGSMPQAIEARAEGGRTIMVVALAIDGLHFGSGRRW